MIAEEADWIIKYFIAASADFFLLESFADINVQNDSVFISRATHTTIQEFLDNTVKLLIASITSMRGSVIISVSSIEH
jgi:hypothetical protein